MMFVLKNAPGTFQYAMDVILSTIQWKVSLMYLDDIVIFSRSPKAHMKNFRLVLALLQNGGVTIKLKK